jgi:hypothetical protein
MRITLLSQQPKLLRCLNVIAFNTHADEQTGTVCQLPMTAPLPSGESELLCRLSEINVNSLPIA